MHSAGQTGVI
jgi:hypothetical protein